ncbi:MAG: cytochrome ubiquinol oxidase subunit I [Candidatus Korarchaeum sp.]
MDLLSQWLNYPAAIDRMLSIIGIEIHWLILQYVLGLPLAITLALLLHARSKDEKWNRMAKTMTKALGIIFAVGAAAGTISEFGLVVIWPNLLEAAGRYIFFPLYAEIFAFLIEITFIYLLVFGWNKMGVKAKITLSLLALFGAWFSGALIMSVNSYMVAPTGIVAAYDPSSGWKYEQGFPKVLLVVPNDVVKVLDVEKLSSLGMEVVSSGENGVSMLLPSKIVSRLVSEAWSNVKLGESVLSLVVRSESLVDLEDLLVKDVVDIIMTNTVRSVGYTTVTFLSPVYLGSILHALGSAVTVTGFTILGAYSLLLMRRKDEYYLAGLRFGALLSLIAILAQGLVFGHILGVQIAENNPEKLAAMEGTSNSILSLGRSLGIERLMSLIVYGSFDAKLPDYDSIRVDYCTLDGVPAISDCRPPLLIHYLYYAKTGLSLLLGLYALIYVLLIYRGGATSLSLLRINVLTPVVAQFVSFLGWAVREMGRKPWSIYGIMTVDVAHTVNPGDPLSYGLIALIMVCVVLVLILAVWKLLYGPSLREVRP